MGIIVEFNPDLALRHYSEFLNGGRKREECLPEILEVGMEYPFLKKDQRNYWLHGEIPLLETRGNGDLSLPLASIVILEATHFLENGCTYTRGKYKVIDVFTDSSCHFNGFTRV